MIDTSVFHFPETVEFYIVSTPGVLADLNNYAQIHVEKEDFSLADFLRRIEFHDAYCYAKPLHFAIRIAISAFKKRLEKRNRWIDMDAFIEAQCVARPEEVIRKLSFPREDVIRVISGSPWAEVFEVDTQAIIDRLLKSPTEDPSSRSGRKH